MKKQQAKIYEAQRTLKTLEAIDWRELIDVQHPARRASKVLDQFDLTQLYEKLYPRSLAKAVRP